MRSCLSVVVRSKPFTSDVPVEPAFTLTSSYTGREPTITVYVSTPNDVPRVPVSALTGYNVAVKFVVFVNPKPVVLSGKEGIVPSAFAATTGPVATTLPVEVSVHSIWYFTPPANWFGKPEVSVSAISPGTPELRIPLPSVTRKFT